MMTGNFKALVLSRLREDDTVNKIQDDQIITNFVTVQVGASMDAGARRSVDVCDDMRWRQRDRPRC
jgi:hypothetical protein